MPDSDAFHVCPAHARRTYARAQRDTSGVPGTRFEVSHLSSTPAPATPLSDHDSTASSEQTAWPIVTTDSEQNEGSMRLRQATLPVGFFALSSAWLTPVLITDFSWQFLVGSVLAFGTMGATLSTFVWMLFVQEASTPRRGAMGAMISNLVAAVCCLPLILFPLTLLVSGNLHDVVDYLPHLVVASMIVGLSAICLSPIAAGLGYIVGTYPSTSLPEWNARPFSWFETPDWQQSTMTLLAVFVLVAGAVVSLAVVQYTDPTSPAVEVPAYAGADAPADVQVAQAESRTRSVSHTVVCSSVTIGENATEPKTIACRINHDLQQDVVLWNCESGELPAYRFMNEDGHWIWSANKSNPQISEMKLVEYWTNADPYFVHASLDANATVQDRTDERVVIRFSKGGGVSAEPLGERGNRTVRIDPETGRLLSITDVWIRSDGVRVETTVQFTNYESTAVDPPRKPMPPLEELIHDLLDGPITGGDTLH